MFAMLTPKEKREIAAKALNRVAVEMAREHIRGIFNDAAKDHARPIVERALKDARPDFFNDFIQRAIQQAIRELLSVTPIRVEAPEMKLILGEPKK